MASFFTNNHYERIGGGESSPSKDSIIRSIILVALITVVSVVVLTNYVHGLRSSSFSTTGGYNDADSSSIMTSSMALVRGNNGVVHMTGDAVQSKDDVVDDGSVVHMDMDMDADEKCTFLFKDYPKPGCGSYCYSYSGCSSSWAKTDEYCKGYCTDNIGCNNCNCCTEHPPPQAWQDYFTSCFKNTAVAATNNNKPTQCWTKSYYDPSINSGTWEACLPGQCQWQPQYKIPGECEWELQFIRYGPQNKDIDRRCGDPCPSLQPSRFCDERS